MKIQHGFLLLATALLMHSTLEAQSFEKGDILPFAGIKIAVYSIDNPNEENEDDDEDDGKGMAASYTITFGGEYALGKRIGVGAEAGICNYFTEEDTITRTIASASSFDLLIRGNFYWVRKERVSLSSGLGIGTSTFRYESNDRLDSKYKGTGLYVRFALLDFRVFITKHFGITTAIGIPYMNYEGGRITDNLGSDFSYPLYFTGFDVGLGLAARF